MPRRILLAEDDLFQATILTQLLSKIDCTVVHAKNGAEAVHLYASSYPTLDLILLDL